jgi:hypothetical protein
MEYLTSLFKNLFVSRNLEFVGMDQNHPRIPRFLRNIPPLFYVCQSIVIKSIETYCYALGIATTNRILTQYRRSHADETSAEEYFLRYDVKPHKTIKDDHYYFALGLVTEWFRPKHLIRPVHFTDLRWYPWNLSTSAERPFTVEPKYKEYVRREYDLGHLDNARMTFHNLYNPIFVYCRQYIHNVKNGHSVTLHPITLHVKPALVHQDEPDKVRTVFGVPKPVILAEAMFFWPLFSHYFTQSSTPLLWNYETLNGGWYRLNNEWYNQYHEFKPIINLDWSEFDMRFYFDAWTDYRANIKSYFDFSGVYARTRTYPHARTDPKKIERLWEWLGYAYFNMESVTTLGKVFRRNFAGMPSGILATQFFDSFDNGVKIVTILDTLGLVVRPHHFIKLMGDDALIGLLTMLPPYQWDSFLEAFAAEAKRRFNMKLNAKKCGISTTIEGASVLGYRNHNGYPSRPRDQLLAQLLWPKSFNDTLGRLKARSIGIYYASAGDPVVRLVCKDIFDYLHNSGIRSEKSGFTGLFDPNFARPFDVDLDHFPSKTEVSCRLAGHSARRCSQQDAYWPREHFLDGA